MPGRGATPGGRELPPAPLGEAEFGACGGAAAVGRSRLTGGDGPQLRDRIGWRDGSSRRHRTGGRRSGAPGQVAARPSGPGVRSAPRLIGRRAGSGGSRLGDGGSFERGSGSGGFCRAPDRRGHGFEGRRRFVYHGSSGRPGSRSCLGGGVAVAGAAAATLGAAAGAALGAGLAAPLSWARRRSATFGSTTLS